MVSVWNIPEPIVKVRVLEAQEKAEEGYSNSYFFLQFFYTDGSKDPINQVGIGVYIPRK